MFDDASFEMSSRAQRAPRMNDATATDPARTPLEQPSATPRDKANKTRRDDNAKSNKNLYRPQNIVKLGEMT